jgi:hypothetical protein
MQDPIPTRPEILKPILALMGSVVGYAFREYQNRISPFVQITNIKGNYFAGWRPISIKKDLYKDFKNSFLIPELPDSPKTLQVYSALQKIRSITKYWPDTKSQIESLLGITNDNEYEEGLYLLLKNPRFDEWFTQLTLKSKIHFSQSSNILPEKIACHADPNATNEGMIWVSTSYGTVGFAKNLKNPAVKARLDPFISNVKNLDLSNINNSLNQFIAIMNNEHTIALAHKNSLQDLIDSNANWMIKITFANLSNQPLLIQSTSILQLKHDKNNVKYSLPCSLALLIKDNEKERIRHTLEPLTLKPGEIITFAMATSQTQQEMSLGDEIRSLFNRKSGFCQIKLEIQKPGLLKHQSIRSPKIHFATTETP